MVERYNETTSWDSAVLSHNHRFLRGRRMISVPKNLMKCCSFMPQPLILATFDLLCLILAVCRGRAAAGSGIQGSYTSGRFTAKGTLHRTRGSSW